jgi:hypothetical protein
VSAVRENRLAPDDPDRGWEFRAEDFAYARLAEELAAAQETPAGPGREGAVCRVESLRLAVTMHAAYVDHNGMSWMRCYTCARTEGFPCSTMRYFTRMWRDHPDYRPGWNDALDAAGGPSWWQQGMLRVAERGGFRNDFLAGEPGEGQTSPSKGDRLE